jgi:O-antigen/teichoic acid export membrane protein
MEETTRSVDELTSPLETDGPDAVRSRGGRPRARISAAVAFRALLERARGPVARGAILSILLTAGGTALSYLVQIFISRTLGVHEYGKYAYVLGIMNVAALIAALDLGGAALRYVGFYSASGQWSLLRGFRRVSRSISVALSLTVALGGAALVALLRDRLDPSLHGALLAACVLLIPATLLQLDLNLLQGLRRVYETRVPNLIVRPLAFALALLVATSLFGAPATAVTGVFANAFGTTFALALSVWLLHRVWPREAREVPSETRTVEWLKFSSASLAGSLLYLVLSQQSDIIVVGSVVGTTDAGLYSVASQVTALVLFGVSTVNHFASPMMAEYQDRPRSAELRGLVRRITYINWAVSLPIVAAIAIGGRLLLATFGRDFTGAYPVLLVLLISQTINAVWGALWGTLLTMMGYQKESFIVVCIVASLNVALTILLTPRFGIVGAATATCIAVVVRGAIVAWIVHRRLGFWPLGRGAVPSFR